MRNLLLAACLLLPTFLQAQEFTSEVELAVRSAIPGTEVDSVEPSELPGIYMVTAGSNVFYFHLEKRLLIFGEIMTTTGTNYTKPNREKAMRSTLSRATDSSLTIQYGEPLNVIYEFTNPECGACLAYEQRLKQQPYENTVRHIFFLSWSPAAKQKLEHIMCSDDKQAAKELVYSGADVTEFASCEYGRDLVNKQTMTARNLGVDRTPTFFVNGTRVIGGNMGKIHSLLKEKSHVETSQSE
jgi:thiol:disulfide interchange protein DsbC